MPVYFGKPSPTCIFEEYKEVIDDLNPKHQRMLLKGLKCYVCLLCDGEVWSKTRPRPLTVTQCPFYSLNVPGEIDFAKL